MAKTAEIPKCPKCGRDPSVRHCIKSPTCTWYRCSHCRSIRHKSLVFDIKGRYFEGEG